MAVAHNQSSNQPWIDTLVNTYAANTANLPISTLVSGGDKTVFYQCCDAPGQCRFFADGDPDPLKSCTVYGLLICSLGNSMYHCQFERFATTAPAAGTITADTTISTNSINISAEGGINNAGKCHQEGSLAVKRSIPCCPTNLSRFLQAQQPCFERFDASSRLGTGVCCQPGETGRCGQYTPELCDTYAWIYYSRFQGPHSAIFSGYTQANKTEFGQMRLSVLRKSSLGRCECDLLCCC